MSSATIYDANGHRVIAYQNGNPDQPIVGYFGNFCIMGKLPLQVMATDDRPKANANRLDQPTIFAKSDAKSSSFGRKPKRPSNLG